MTMPCLVDLWDVCPECSVTHHDRVITEDTADLWWPSPTNPIVTTNAVPSGDNDTKEHTMADYDFEDQILTHAYVEARALADGKVPVFDRSGVDL